jgi:hypothetical protein
MSALKQFFSTGIILGSIGLIFLLLDCSIQVIYPWLTQKSGLIILLIGIAGVLITKFITPIFGLLLALTYASLDIKVYRNLINLACVLLSLWWLSMTFGIVVNTFKHYSFSNLIVCLFIISWIGNITWYSSRFLWREE